MGVKDSIVKGFGKTKRVAGWTAGIIAGVTALSAWAASSRSSARARANDDFKNANATMDTPAVMMPNMVPMTPSEVGPAEGHAPGEWQGRINASRGLAPQQAAPLNPKMSVTSDVQDLGTPTQPTR